MKTAVITGASRGIGLQIAKTLLEKGYAAVLTARAKSEEIRELETRFGSRVAFIAADIGRESDRRSILASAMESFGGVVLLVNNAGVAPRERKDMLEITEEDYDYVMDINLKGTYFLTQEAARQMLLAGEGRIINIGSISHDTVSLNRAEYCISKAGVHMLTQLFAVRLAGKNVKVFEISPGVIDTPMIEKVKDKYNALAEKGTIPAKRLGTPRDIAGIVSAIADGLLDYAAGTDIRCDGAMHIPVL